MKGPHKSLAFMGMLIPLFHAGYGERLVVSTTAGDTAWVITVVGAYQMEDEIWVTSDTERAYGGGWTMISYPKDVITIDAPSVVAKHVGDLEWVGSNNPIYLCRKQVSEFDYSAGDGWVDTDSCGWLYIRLYPWVYHIALGWLFSTEGAIVQGTVVPDDLLEKEWKLSFYLYSDKFGWLWKSPFNERYYSYKLGAYKSLEELLGD
jgi:hypothetical protein